MSILDFKQNHLCDDIWDEHHNLQSQVKEFILKAFENFFNDASIVGYDKFAVDIVIGSSLATYYYTKTSDFDVKLIYDEAEFLKYNPKFKNLPSEYSSLSDYLIRTGRTNYYLTAPVTYTDISQQPSTIVTDHNLDCYFYSTVEFAPISLYDFDSLYSVNQNRWIQEPKEIPTDFSPDFILEYAWSKAQSYIAKIADDITSAKKSLIDIICLRDYLKVLDEDDIENLKDFFVRKFEEVNSDITTLIADKVDLKALRLEGYDKTELSSDLEKMFGSFNYSDENLIYKVLQRYGYLTIIWEVSDLYKKEGITIDNINNFVNAVM